mmetsp:Transcript_26335/g.55496  ORF Transcript_26335/g.55496 Transcript_26335/m.55496 type:complete len:206 (+) Transcript_26335:776-1393(+)
MTNGSKSHNQAFTIARCSARAMSWPQVKASHVPQRMIVLDLFPQVTFPSTPMVDVPAKLPADCIESTLCIAGGDPGLVIPLSPLIEADFPLLSPNAKVSACANIAHIRSSWLDKIASIDIIRSFLESDAHDESCGSSVVMNSMERRCELLYSDISFAIPSKTGEGDEILSVPNRCRPNFLAPFSFFSLFPSPFNNLSSSAATNLG